jgi:hypothetical protein
MLELNDKLEEIAFKMNEDEVKELIEKTLKEKEEAKAKEESEKWARLRGSMREFADGM